MIHLWKAELSRIIKIYTYGYFEVNQYLKCSLVCNHVDFKVNSPEKLGRERDNCKIRIGSLNSSSSYVVTWLLAIKSTAFTSLIL